MRNLNRDCRERCVPGGLHNATLFCELCRNSKLANIIMNSEIKADTFGNFNTNILSSSLINVCFIILNYGKQSWYQMLDLHTILMDPNFVLNPANILELRNLFDLHLIPLVQNVKNHEEVQRVWQTFTGGKLTSKQKTSLFTLFYTIVLTRTKETIIDLQKTKKIKVIGAISHVFRKSENFYKLLDILPRLIDKLMNHHLDFGDINYILDNLISTDYTLSWIHNAIHDKLSMHGLKTDIGLTISDSQQQGLVSYVPKILSIYNSVTNTTIDHGGNLQQEETREVEVNLCDRLLIIDGQTRATIRLPCYCTVKIVKDIILQKAQKKKNYAYCQPKHITLTDGTEINDRWFQTMGDKTVNLTYPTEFITPVTYDGQVHHIRHGMVTMSELLDMIVNQLGLYTDITEGYRFYSNHRFYKNHPVDDIDFKYEKYYILKKIQKTYCLTIHCDGDHIRIVYEPYILFEQLLELCQHIFRKKLSKRVPDVLLYGQYETLDLSNQKK
jgi:hypothetical protein